MKEESYNDLENDKELKEDINSILKSQQVENIKIVHVYEDSNQVPEDIKGWNWGAFGLTLYWSIGNKVYLGLLILLSMVPYAGFVFAIVWKIVIAAKGNEWAWKAGKYKSVEEYKKVQESWKMPGIVAFILGILSIFIVFLFLIFFMAIFFSIINSYNSNIGNTGIYDSTDTYKF
ncbi:ribonuclease G [Floricoccus penangensis]|uniref:ribonuclease G n=1 Tax=Floricoccus penangensis TaxID=1859475 RepID=UPI001E36045B|nr:ribonuclease G [Floricoccus penangensis]